MKTALRIMAAGIGSRFGTGIKQLEPVDASEHIIMDYSIHDAIEADFDHVVFIIRKYIEKKFKKCIGDRIAAICNSRNVTVDYAFQDINDIPGTLPEGRTKPWGTGQAVLAAKKIIKTPFIVINADDYYGKEGFKAVHEYLVNGGKSCMAGFVVFFKKEVPADPMKAEYLIPTFIGELLAENKMSVKVLRSNDTWYGMTYKEDVVTVKENFEEMLKTEVYKEDLFSDLQYVKVQRLELAGQSVLILEKYFNTVICEKY